MPRRKTYDPMEVPDPADNPDPDAVPTGTTDEGIAVEMPDSETVINVTSPTDDFLGSRRRELHVNGHAFHHVADRADGAWIYRRDR